MRKSHKIITAVAIAGIVFAGGSAFTGTGLENTKVAEQFIGGTVSQKVTGATLSEVEYVFTDDPANTTVGTIRLTFSEALPDHPVSVVATGGAGGAFTCGEFVDTVSTCNSETGYIGLTDLDITVAAPLPTP